MVRRRSRSRGSGALTSRGFGIALGVATLAAALLIAASLFGAEVTTSSPTERAAPARTFEGIAQSGLALGSPDASVTLIEYADLQCPYCALWAGDVLPVIVREYVRSGRVRLVFHGLAFIGPESDAALRATLAAGAQNRLWDYAELLYRRQGHENSGWFDHQLARAVAESTGVDAEQLLADAASSARDGEIAAAARAAESAGMTGTPSFEVGRTGETMELVADGSFENLSAKIDALLR
jgi:protein-disulfide isomerase